MKEVNAKGLKCPRPLIMAKKSLTEISVGESFKMLIDNETAMNNVKRFLNENGASVECTDKDGYSELLVKKIDEKKQATEAVHFYPNTHKKKSNYVIAIKKDKMGTGDEKLGRLLLESFINTIEDVDTLPETIIFYNSGIYLTVEGSPVVATLRRLESKGIKILVCGTCLEYYGMKERIKVGIVSNMYEIVENLSRAHHVIFP